MRKTLACLAFALSLTTAPSLSAEPLKVVASFSIIADMAKNVGGDRVEVTMLVGADSDAHAFEPKPADAAKMVDADIVLVNGLGFDSFIERLAKAGSTKAPIVELTAGIKPLEAEEEGHHHEGEHHHSDVDPHAFQSAANAIVYVRNIADALCKADAAGCDAYRANAAAYTTKLEALDAEIKAQVASIPADRRTVITTHDAFGYFEHAYDIKFLAPEGIATKAEASAGDVAALVKQVREKRVAGLFLETISDPRLMQRIADETGLRIGGTLYSDALSPADGPAATYIDMMRYNARTIKAAVEGS